MVGLTLDLHNSGESDASRSAVSGGGTSKVSQQALELQAVKCYATIVVWVMYSVYSPLSMDMGHPVVVKVFWKQEIILYPLFDLILSGCPPFMFYSVWMSTVDLGSNVIYKPFTLTTLIDTLVIEVVIGEQIIIRECYDRCIIDLSRESFYGGIIYFRVVKLSHFARM